jgi:dTDP-L-rhamnose 4-epimerase
VHFAAAVGVGQSMYQPFNYVKTNAVGTAAVLEQALAKRDQIRKLVVASSMSLYGEGAYRCNACGGTTPKRRDDAQLAAGVWEVSCARCGAALEPLPTPETKPAEIASVYAATKQHQEDLFVTCGQAYHIPTFALRFFNVFGPRQSLSNPYTGVAAIFISRLLSGQSPVVFEDGRQTRDLVDVRDVARCVALALEYPGDGQFVLNVGTGRATSILGVANTLAAQLGRDVTPTLLGRYRAGDIRHCVADPSRAREVLGFEAAHTFEEGLPTLIDWCRGQHVEDRVDVSLKELQSRGLVR